MKDINKSETVTISELIYNRLKKAIIEGEFAEGEKLSTENISKQLKVSRMPVREAFRKLEANGLVKIMPQIGVKVSEISIKEFTEITKLRVILEREAMKILCQNREQLDLSKVEELLILERQTSDVKEKLKIRKNIHLALYELTDNTILIDEIKRIIDKFDRYLYLHLKHIVEPNKYDHSELIDIIKKCNVDEAANTLENHILSLYYEVLEIIQEKI